MENTFVEAFNRVQEEVHRTAIDKGFWDNRLRLENTAGTVDDFPFYQFARSTTSLAALALVVSEVSEAAEAIRLGNPPDDKIPNLAEPKQNWPMRLSVSWIWRVREAGELLKPLRRSDPSTPQDLIFTGRSCSLHFVQICKRQWN